MHKVRFVGCGPGDPDLITVKAKRAVQRARTVVYSGSLIPEPVISMCRKAALHDASGLVREQITELLCEGAKKGATVRLHDGDPAIYGAIKEQIDALAERGVESEVIPGVTALLAASAALGVQLTLPGVTQTVILSRAEARTKVPERESTKSLAGHGATMAFYLSVHLLPRITKEALAGGYPKDTPAAVVYRASWPDQKIVRGTLKDIAAKTRKAGITRTAVVLVGAALEPSEYEHSRLYDSSFSHGYRRATRGA